MKQYILLDWDGNLARTLDVWLHACRVALEKRGLKLTDEEIATCFGAVTERFEHWGVTDIEAAIDELHDEAAKLMPDVELYLDALEVLEAFKQRGKRIALITASRRFHIIHLLDKYNLHDYFDVVITKEDTERHKPDPEPLFKALRELGGTKDEAIMIGDSDKDIGAANNAGIDSILFYPDEHKKFYKLDDLKLHQPTYVVEDFREILEIVQ